MNENKQNIVPTVSPTPEVTQPPVETGPTAAPEAPGRAEKAQVSQEGGVNAEVAQEASDATTEVVAEEVMESPKGREAIMLDEELVTPEPVAIVAETAPVVEKQAATEVAAPKPAKKSHKGLIIAIIATVVLAIGAVAAWWLITKDKTEETIDDSNSTEVEKPTSSDEGQNGLPVAAGDDESLEDELRKIRDAERSNSLARVVNTVLQYQVNNNGQLPRDGYIAPVREDIYGLVSMESYNDSNNTAAVLIKNYLNVVGAEYNEFIDPDGVAFGLKIAALDKGVEIESVDDDYTIYIYKEAICEGGKAVSSNNTRDYVVMYKLEDGTVYCVGSN